MQNQETHTLKAGTLKRRCKVRITSEEEINNILSQLERYIHEIESEEEDNTIERYDELYEPFVDREKYEELNPDPEELIAHSKRTKTHRRNYGLSCVKP